MATPRVVACWSMIGGAGTSVVAAAMACALGARHDDALLVDARGDQGTIFGVEADGPGLADWCRAGEAVPPDALGRIEVRATPHVALLPRGPGELDAARAEVLVALLRSDHRPTVIDLGLDPFGRTVAAASDASILVARACPIALSRLRRLPVQPTGVVVVRGHRRTTPRAAIAAAAGAPVVAEVDLDPAVGAAVDAGIAHRRLPRRFLEVLGRVA